MKKRMVLILILALSIVGCQSQGNNNTAEQVVEKTDVTAEESQIGVQGEIELEILVDWLGVFNTPIVSNSNGSYEIMYNTDGSANILYTDIATRQRIYLSSDLSSDHHSEADSSWIENAQGGCFLFTTDDHLYMSHYGDSDTPGRLYQMGLDGKNRKALAVFDAYEAITGAVVTDSKSLYTILVNEKSENVLVGIDLLDGNIKELCNLGEHAAFIMSAYTDKLLIKTITQPETVNEPMDFYYNQGHHLYEYSLSDQSLEEVCVWKQDTVFETYCNEDVYMFDKETDSIILYDALNKTQVTLVSSLKELGVSYDQIVSVHPVIDSHLVFSLDDGETMQRKAYDLNNSILTEIKGQDGSFLGIVGEYEEDFLVTAGALEVPVEDTAPDGTPMVTMMQMQKLALIKKADFWKNSYELEYIEDVFLN